MCILKKLKELENSGKWLLRFDIYYIKINQIITMTQLVEQFKPIEGFEDYLLSNYGYVISNKYGKVRKLKNRINGPGYASVMLSQDGKVKIFVTHQLVVKYFHPEGNHTQCINHIDGNKINNKIDNLEPCTYKYNINDAIKMNLRRNIEGLVEKRKVTIVDKELNLISASSLLEASKILGTTVQAIYNGCTGRQKTVKGFTVSYAN